MTLVDSADSIIMLYSYTGFPERSLVVFSKEKVETPKEVDAEEAKPISDEKMKSEAVQEISEVAITDPEKALEEEAAEQRRVIPAIQPATTETDNRVKMNVMSGLSIILTLMSILVAFRYAVTRPVTCRV